MRIYNIKDTHVDGDDPRSGILASSEFTICSTENMLKFYSAGQLIFGCGTIFLIQHKVHWKLVCQINQTKINRDNIYKNSNRVDQD